MTHLSRSPRLLKCAPSALALVTLTGSSCGSGEPPPPDAESSLARSGEAVRAAPVWSLTGKTVHSYTERPSLTVLPSGKVLLLGAGSSEIYDPATNSWTAAAPLSSGGGITALLQNGKVLIPLLPHSQVYDPLSDGWTPAAPPPLGAGGPTDNAVGLPSGDVLLKGQRYHPATDTWSLTASPPFTLQGPANLLPSGKVLFTQGPCTYDPVTHDGSCAGAVYDPATDSWAPIAARPPLPAPLFSSTSPYLQPYETFYATLLLDGTVLVNGMARTYPPPSQPFPSPGFPYLGWQIYDPISDAWSLGHDPSDVLNGQAQTRLKTGEVLLAAGQALFPAFNTELYDPITRAIQILAAPPCAGFILGGPAIVRLPAGRVLLVCADTAQQGAALYDPTAAAPCGAAAECASGFCVDGVCCNASCNAGPCDACSAVLGASADGTCTPLTGAPCNDNNACTLNDTCQAGVCKGGTLLDPCLAADVCRRPGACDL